MYGPEAHLKNPSFYRFYSNKYFGEILDDKELIKGLKVNNGMDVLQFELWHLDRNRWFRQRTFEDLYPSRINSFGNQKNTVRHLQTYSFEISLDYETQNLSNSMDQIFFE